MIFFSAMCEILYKLHYKMHLRFTYSFALFSEICYWYVNIGQKNGAFCEN